MGMRLGFFGQIAWKILEVKPRIHEPSPSIIEGATHKTKIAKNYENWHLPTSIYLHWFIKPDTSCNQFQRWFGMILELFRNNMNTAMHA